MNETVQAGGAGALVGLLTSLIGDRSVKRSLLSTALGGATGAGLQGLSNLADESPAPAGPTTPAKDKTLSKGTAAAAGLLPVIGPAAHAGVVTGDWKDAAREGGSSWAGGITGLGLGAMIKNKPDASGAGNKKLTALKLLLPLLGSGAGAAVGADWANKSAASVEDIMPEPSALSALGDFSNSPSARRRAGRATAMAEAFQEDPGLTVSNPSATRFVSGLLSSIAGGAAGLSIGDNMGRTRGGQRFHDGLIGAGVGGMASSIINAILRRREIKRIKEVVSEKIEKGVTPLPVFDDSSATAGLVNGRHQQGRADVAEALSYGRNTFAKDHAMDAVDIASNVPLLGKLLLPAQLAKSVADNVDARSRIRNAIPRPESYEGHSVGKINQ